ncbi:hypothetical protein [Fusobacterium sp.]|uniref:hypothetical protein n=1 Tax=Fusobacterium sp. TaxID=68766 RepID=UPI0026172026|nr:hypothetical protein [Fusobacterium sp.]MDU7069294.1 hypothetical protein [Clostridium perfringens]
MNKVYLKKKIRNREEGEQIIEWNLHDKLLKIISSLEKEGVFNEYFMSYSIEYHDEYIKFKLYKSIDY